MSDIETLRKIEEHAPHWLTPEDRRILRMHEPVNQMRSRTLPLIGIVFCVAALAALPLFAEPVGPLSTVDLETSDMPGAVGQVTFNNRLEAVPNTLDVDLGEGVTAHFQISPGDIPDRMTLTVPEGYITVPQFVDVGENESGTIVIYSMDGVGM